MSSKVIASVVRLRAKAALFARCSRDISSDNGPEFIAKAVQKWIGVVGAKTAYIATGRPVGERVHRKLSAAQHSSAVRPHAPSASRLRLLTCSRQPSQHGRLRNPHQLRRPC
jgi:hypothetical protein